MINRALILGLILAASSNAEVSSEDAQKLGTSLTPVGAEMAGNAEGTIPAWDNASEFAGIDGRGQGGRQPVINPFADESVRFVINVTNVDRYVDKLSMGQIVMVKIYPESYQLPIYRTHRTFSNPEIIYRVAKQNAQNAWLVNDGNGVVGHTMAYPFPIPHGSNEEQAKQIMWNHMFRWRNGAVSRHVVQIAPTRQGTYSTTRLTESFTFRESLTDFQLATDPNIHFYFKQQIEAPVSMAGNILLIHETLDQVKENRRAWMYNRAERRVRRSPTVAYDSPGTAADGLRTNDDFDLFNGSMDRYDWRLLGKREVFVPYNNFELTNPQYRYADLLENHHLNPEKLRYELHRVWVVEASLKEAEKHIYKKRVFYVDEDSWQIVLVDHYNQDDELWRVSEGFHVHYYHRGVAWVAAHAIYDLFNRRYLVNGLSNEEPVAFNWQYLASSQEFIPAAIRREGH